MSNQVQCEHCRDCGLVCERCKKDEANCTCVWDPCHEDDFEMIECPYCKGKQGEQK